MTQPTRAAFVALAILIGLTTTKFILYSISGSIAVLSEAWHSVADIATTSLVIVSIIRQSRKRKTSLPLEGPLPPSQESEYDTQPKKYLSRIRRWLQWLHEINTELKISLVIGIVLFSAASTILWNAITSGSAKVASPLVTGVIFIGLSFGSFFIYRFEESIGGTEKSAALIADSQHNRADMVISLLTGISLIVYYFGTNLDRWLGIFIALYILSFTVELIVNTISAIIRNRQEMAFEYRFVSIMNQVFRAQTYQSTFQFLDKHITVGRGGTSLLNTLLVMVRWTFRWVVRLVAAAVVVLYLSTMIYTVKPDEEALLLRFGKIVNVAKAIQPGLHLKLPYPIDKAVRFQTKKIRTISVGNTSGTESAMIWTKEHGDNRTFISGDDNLFLPFIVIHYRIKNIHDYYTTHRDGIPAKMLASESYCNLNRIFSQTAFYDLILNKRLEWNTSLKELLQAECDSLRTGLEIVQFCLKDLHPPVALAEAYENVVAAKQLRDKLLNDAERGANYVVSQARMKAMIVVTRAESYAFEKKNLAEGEAKNYLLRYSGYQAGGDVIRRLLLLRFAEATLKKKTLCLVDPESGIEEKLIYIEEHLAKGRKR